MNVTPFRLDGCMFDVGGSLSELRWGAALVDGAVPERVPGHAARRRHR